MLTDNHTERLTFVNVKKMSRAGAEPRQVQCKLMLAEDVNNPAETKQGPNKTIGV